MIGGKKIEAKGTTHNGETPVLSGVWY